MQCIIEQLKKDFSKYCNSLLVCLTRASFMSLLTERSFTFIHSLHANLKLLSRIWLMETVQPKQTVCLIPDEMCHIGSKIL